MDEISNEFLKYGQNLSPTLELLFNKVLETGMIPKAWSNGMIIPILKKGNTKDPNNYRGITLLSCIGKLFTSLINNRLTEFLELNEILNQNQAGFRKGLSITEHIFTLKTVIDIFISEKRKLYCVFIDFQKAFDTIWRKALWYKLVRSGINGKVLNVIQSMYQNIKSCVFVNGKKSDFFESGIGLRQGENLSPVLFSLYVNDLESYLMQQNVTPIEMKLRSIDDEPWLKLLVLLYADDTVILSDTPAGLQHCLDKICEYCRQWKLVINKEKTKAMVFERRKSAILPVFFINGQEIETVCEFKYLGVVFTHTGSFRKHLALLVEQARKAMFYVLNRVQEYSLDIDVALQLFDAMVSPILTFGGEVWGFEKLDIIERLHLQFCKYILRLKRSTPNAFVYGELGRYPIKMNIQVKMIKFWGKLIVNERSIAGSLYRVLYNRENEKKISKWFSCVKNILEKCGLAYIWISQNFRTTKHLGEMVKRRLHDQYIQEWRTTLNDMSKAVIYREVKLSWGFEKYLSHLNHEERIILCKFRCGNHPLPIEKGRFSNIPRNERLCTKCNMGMLGDEFHFVLCCPFFKDMRKTFISTSCQNPNIYKYVSLFNSPVKELKKLVIFLKRGLRNF